MFGRYLSYIATTFILSLEDQSSNPGEDQPLTQNEQLYANLELYSIALVTANSTPEMFIF